jgi:glycerol-3-phosphate O-acyltransferase
MDRTVTFPLWLAALLVLLAAWAALDRLLVPSVRWYLHRRVNRLIDEVNARLRLEIRPFQRTRRRVLIDRLLYDPKLLAAIEAEAQSSGAPREVVTARVARYAREIVPAFNPYLYFRLGYRLARGVARLLYRVRLGFSDEPGLAAIERGATVVFLMNHRSNMDYVLVAYLAADRTTLSYAVGEWARIWPLQTLVRSMGAYFVRRNSGDPLYRRVLERYVAMATAGGVTQAVYPEGGLSRDGRLRPPKLGLLDYMLRGFDPHGERDLVFVPVGINYDRVLEDRTLLLDLDPGAPRGGAGAAIANTLRFVARNLGQMAGRRWHRFGYACANFGSPVSTRRWLGERGLDLRQLEARPADRGTDSASSHSPDTARRPSRLERDGRSAHVERLARELMAAVGAVVPVLPVPLVATVLLDAAAPLSELEIKARAHRLMRELGDGGAHVYIPRGDQDYAVTAGLRALVERHLVATGDGLYAARPEEQRLLRYYANSIAHLLPATEATPERT